MQRSSQYPAFSSRPISGVRHPAGQRCEAPAVKRPPVLGCRRDGPILEPSLARSRKRTERRRIAGFSTTYVRTARILGDEAGLSVLRRRLPISRMESNARPPAQHPQQHYQRPRQSDVRALALAHVMDSGSLLPFPSRLEPRPLRLHRRVREHA